MSDKLTVINEMTEADARLLPDSVRQAILATVQPPATPPEVAQVQELRTALGVDDKADLTKLVTELRTEQETQRKNAVKNRITELAADPEKGVKLDTVRGLVVELVNARNPQTEAEADAAFAAVMASPAVAATLLGTVRETMGPRQGTPVAGQNGKTNRYFQIPQEA